jgi:hypothetical protein
VLYAPQLHEPVIDAAWEPERVRAGIRAIAEDAEAAFDDGWLIHPADDPTPDDPERPRNVYLGGAGVVHALTLLAERDLIEPVRDYVPYLDRPFSPDWPDLDHRPSLWGGELGILYVLHRLAPTAATADRIAELVAANSEDPHCELMWGSPGSMLAARAMHEATGEQRWLELWRRSASWLRGRVEPDTGVWQQELNGRQARYIGPAHGFTGCVLALSAEPDAELERLAADTTRRYAVEEEGQANWPPVADPRVKLEVPGQGIRTQWCHGAPGVVASLAGLAAGDAEHERLMIAGGELTWTAGPPAKGANLCHGTAGNGHAFLALHARTGDELWLERARAFAMHALAQVERWRVEIGRGRHTLWTGDVGTALYLADCLDGRGRLPLP